MPRAPFARRPFGLAAVALVGIAACSSDPLATPSGPAISEPMTPVAPAGGGLASYTANSWQGKSDMPTARRGLVTATVNGIVYAIGGRSSNEVNLRTVEAFNPGGTIITTKWKTKAQLPAPRAWPSGAQTINGKIYVAGGLNANGDPTRSLYVYNPETDTWATKAQIPVASWGGGSGVINDKLYVVTPGPNASQLHRYDPATNTWTARAQGPAGHYYAVTGVIDGKLYLAGTMNADESPSTLVAMYDPATNTWTAKAGFNEHKIGAAGRVIGGKLYLVGGFEELNQYPASGLYAYSPATNTWAEKQHMPSGRGFLSAAASNGVLYAIGGLASPTVLRSNQAYTP
jgi:N-acetylneuraminic acid mutarotase